MKTEGGCEQGVRVGGTVLFYEVYLFIYLFNLIF
jgi:hypothetical protein